MEFIRIRELMDLWFEIRSSRVALIGGNHTSARFCSR
ncbi:hypothetical protein DCAR_0101748 [Daucus carota subsp. sativus]|uniref:Uncharacterized protein n=1 Tax=Daucus carota subsp. sativus TaxID=79200 RepID=A0AAF0W6N1_DAUCS|nr:PREDICTED: uncharacterized protein LOC108204784 [Daucus carota subsp. sativus]WOG82583.1 hypothetical protein DCAR_0101748 [Daucus carota subsp. sativus]